MSEISTLYLKTHNKTGLQYLGVTYKDPLTYEGSGVHWKRHIRKHGRHDVTTEILFQDKMIGKYTSDKFQEESKEWSTVLDVVKEDNFANKQHENGVMGAKNNIWHGFDDLQDKWENKLSKDKVLKNTDKFEYTTNKQKVGFVPKQVDVELSVMPMQESDSIMSKLRETTTIVLSSLTPREERVMRMRYGIGMNTDHTLMEVGKQFSVGPQRIREIEAKALRKLKHPDRSRKLRSFLEN